MVVNEKDGTQLVLIPEGEFLANSARFHSAYRLSYLTDFRISIIGFRCARTV